MKRDLDTIILTRQELQIMKVVWDMGSATVKQVCGALSQRKQTAYTTILTLMGILEDKGVLTHMRSGRAYIYWPLLSREQATKNQIRDLVLRFFDGKPERLIETVLETQSPARGQIDRLESSRKSSEEHQLL